MITIEIRMYLFLFVGFASFFNIGNACTMEDVVLWPLPLSEDILDVNNTIVISKSTSNIDGISSYTFGEGLVGGPYLNVEHSNNRFVVSTNEKYPDFEKYEVSGGMSVTVVFACTGGGTETLLVLVNVIDTNNNSPEFLPNDEYEFVVTPPLPPGYLLTGCSHELIVRDIDLTTYRIDFAIQENPFIEIEYDEIGSADIDRKQFKAILRTTSFIRTLEEPLTLWISATDVDQTGNDTRTTQATLRIVPDTEFVIPPEPIFSQTFYLANYTEDHQLILFDTIYLQQGYDEYVNFKLEGEYFSHFQLTPTADNQMTIISLNTLPIRDISEHQIHLVLRAEREYTNGDTATVIIRLPEITPLRFDKPLYDGKLTDNILEAPQLVLSQGYENKIVTAEVVGEYSAYFTADAEGNLVTITMRGETEDIIRNNNFISLQIRASTDDSESTTVLILDIIKDDNVTPVFDKSIYNGAYDPVTGLTALQIVFVQGFDETVTTELFGEHESYFDIDRSVTGVITITSTGIPEEIFSEQNIILSIKASKERTVGANAAIIISLPAAKELEFEEPFYKGTIQDNAMAALQDILLRDSYEGTLNFILSRDSQTGTDELFSKLLYEGVLRNGIVSHETITLTGYSGTEVELFGEYSLLFEASLSNEVVTVSAKTPFTLPTGLTHLTLELRAGTASAVLLLNIETEDTPIISFSKVLFGGDIRDDIVNHETITLFGYSGSEVELFGEYASLFEAVLNNNAVTVSTRSSVTLPTGLTYLTLELRAGTARAVLLLSMENTESNESFSKVLYEGDIQNDIVNHETITLFGYSGTEVELSGEYSSLFEAVFTNNAVIINTRSSVTLPSGLTHLTLELRAGTARSVLLLNIENIDTPSESNGLFSKVLFEGVIQNDIVSHETISISGYFGTDVELRGEFAPLFEAVLTNNAVNVDIRSSVTLPTGLTHLTLELRAGTARAVLVLSIENTDSPTESSESFSKVLFEGVLSNDVVDHETITLFRYSGTEVELFGEHSSLFEAVLTNNAVTVDIRSSVTLPSGLAHLALELRAGTARAVLLLNIENLDTPSESNGLFSKVLFEGVIQNDIISHETISLSGYSGTDVELLGEFAPLFEAVLTNNAVYVDKRPSVTLPAGLTHLTLELRAGTARAVLLLNIENNDSPTESSESFSKVLYEGVLSNDVVDHETIMLFGYSGTEVELFGEHSSLFEAVLTNNAVTVDIRSSVTLPTGLTHLTLELRAGTARAVLLLNIENLDTPSESNELFSKVLFEGVIQNDIVSHETISLSGYSGTDVELLGEFSPIFEAVLTNNAVYVDKRSSVTLPAGLTHLTLELRAGTARAVLLLNIENTDSPTESSESFSKVLYEGVLSNGVVDHETIMLFGYSGTEVELFGEHSSLFEAVLTNNAVTVDIRSSVTLPSGLTHLTLELRAGTARAVLLLNIENLDPPSESNGLFSKVLFEGVIQDDIVSHETISLSGYSGTDVELLGEFAPLFEAVLTNNAVYVDKRSSVILPAGLTHLTLELRAGTARAVLLLNIENTDSPTESSESFSKVLFEGVLSNGVVEHETIMLFGYSGTEVELFGEHSSLFEAGLTNNAVTVDIRSSVTLPSGLTHVTLELRAGTARAVLLFKIENLEKPTESNGLFSKVLFEGVIQNNIVSHETISLSGYSGTDVELLGEFAPLFEAILSNNAVYVDKRSSVTLPAGLTHLTLELRAGTARAVLLLNIENTDPPTESSESFSKVLFEGVLSNGVVDHETIMLFGYSGTEVELFGEHSSLFEAVLTNNAVTVDMRSSVTLPSGLAHLALELRAGTARAVLLLNIENLETPSESNGLFSKILFEGVIQNDIVSHETISLSGYSGTDVELLGEFAPLFEAVLSNNAVFVDKRPSVTLPAGLTHLTLELRAGTARAVLLLSIENTDSPTESSESFSKVLYEGVLSNGVVEHETIMLFGYSGTEVGLFGEHSSLFEAVPTNNVVTVETRSSVTIPSGLTHLTLELRAGTARAVLLLNIENIDTPIGSNESFNKVLFGGVIRNDIVSHEIITLSEYSGTEVELLGQYASLFEATLSNEIVTVTAKTPLTLPTGLTQLTLELRAGTASAVLLLNIEEIESPVTPVVTFSSESYSIRVEITQTGLVGQVRATADTGEPINYSLQLDNSHLEERLSVNNVGELHLSAPVRGGLYAFRVVGTTAYTNAIGTATVHMSIEAVTVCGDDLVMPPLMTLDRDEEEPHHDLLSETQYEGCHFSIANRWPLDQTWLYVDETGLHTRAIDREHESIAFMPLSQVQVEITLHCDNDDTRVKRSLNSESLGPYDYGPNKWILTDSILYNRRKTLLNLIVNDINDNAPIFDDKANEPVAVGYPIPELENIVLPRSLTQLHATDADIGENAAIVYSSPNSELAVAPLTGFVHVRNGARLEQNALMTVHATDRNGQGNIGSINLIVKLLDQSNIAVVTVRDAFLDDEASIISNLSDAVGYDVKVLRSVVISQDEENYDVRRAKRETTNTSGASLELYIYGIRERDPVNVDRLTTDISNAASTITVNVENIVSLEDHLESLEICAIMERDSGLLVATIVLSILLFAVIVLIAIWAFLKWRKNTYQKFDDQNSLASRSESLDQTPKPGILPKPRINPDDLMRSERRLQEILDTPIEGITVEPIAAVRSLPMSNDLIELPSPEPNTPIVIQSIDKLKDPADDLSDDEFGEIKQPRRKSVVTFNENVEKIIHVEDNEDSEDVTSDPDLEVYKF